MFKKSIVTTLLALSWIMSSCKKNEAATVVPKVTDTEYVRLLVGDASSTRLSFVNMHTLQVKAYEALFPAASLYTSSTHRYAFINHAAKDQVQVFDSGIEDHGDHGHDDGSQMLALSIPVAKPTHFHDSYGYNVFFNDDDGSITLLEDHLLEASQTYTPIKYPVATKHHGAAVPFENGNVAVTDKDVSVPGQTASLPQKVVVINKAGSLLHSPTTRVAGMHGSTSFDAGRKAAFGTTQGVFVVDQNGGEQLIANSDTLEKAKKWIGTLLSHGKLTFAYGMATGLGLFKIDPVQDTILPLLYADNIAACVLDKTSKHLVVLLKSGNVKLYDAKTGLLKAEASNLVGPITNDTEHRKYFPSMAVSGLYLYITDPDKGMLYYFHLQDLTKAGSISLGGQPTKMVLF